MTPAELRALLAKATSKNDGPPWHAKRLTDQASIRTDRPDALPHDTNRLVAVMAQGVREQWLHADLIVAAVNTLPVFVELWEAAEHLRAEKQKVNDAAKRGTLLATGALTAADEALFAALAKLETP